MTVGVLGAGQLGRMLALAGYPLGHRFRFFDPSPESPAGHVAELCVAQYDDHDALERFADGLDVVTYEFENVPTEAAQFLADRLPVFPPPEALAAAQDRLEEKTLFSRLDIPTPKFRRVDTHEEFVEAIDAIGIPSVLKTRRSGYDGKGQAVLHGERDVEPAWERFQGKPLLLEEFMPFEREVSCLAVRSRDGNTCFYPLVENHHRGGILRLSIAPAPDLGDALQRMGEEYATRVLDQLSYVGVFAFEFFVMNGTLYANEMACRVHNSGHWSIEGAEVSQFENHVRAITGSPLGSTGPVGVSVMFNILGEVQELPSVLAMPFAHVHLYGKDARPGRKIGHVTLRAPSLDAMQNQVLQLEHVFDVSSRRVGVPF